MDSFTKLGPVLPMSVNLYLVKQIRQLYNKDLSRLALGSFL